PALARALAVRVPAGRRARGRGGRPGARDPRAPTQGHRGDDERGTHLRVRHPVGAVRGLRGPLLRLLRRPLRAIRPQRDHRRDGDRARPLPGIDPDHLAGDVPARHAVRPEVGVHRHLPDRVRGGAHPRRAVRPRGAGGAGDPAARAVGAGERVSATAPASALLTLERVTKRFGGLTAVREVSLQVQPGDLLGIIGPNGAGKTTLFHVISGYFRPDEGRVVFDGRDVTGLPAHAISRL